MLPHGDSQLVRHGLYPPGNAAVQGLEGDQGHTTFGMFLSSALCIQGSFRDMLLERDYLLAEFLLGARGVA